MKKIKYNNIEVFNKVLTLHIVMHYEKSCHEVYTSMQVEDIKLARNNLVSFGISNHQKRFENMQLDIISQTWIISNYAHTQISSKLNIINCINHIKTNIINI